MGSDWRITKIVIRLIKNKSQYLDNKLAMDFADLIKFPRSWNNNGHGLIKRGKFEQLHELMEL